MSVIFDKYLKMNYLQKFCAFFFDYQVATIIKEMLSLKVALVQFSW